MISSLLHLVKRSRKPAGYFTEFMQKQRNRYLQNFTEEYQSLIATRLNITLFTLALLPGAVIRSIKFGHLLYAMTFLPLLLSAIFYSTLARVLPLRVKYLAAVFLAVCYLANNSLNISFSLTRPGEAVAVGNVVFALTLSCLCIGLMAVTPYLLEMLLINATILLVNYLVNRANLQQMGANILLQYLQGMVLSGVISTIILLMIRYRILSRLQMTEIEMAAEKNAKILHAINQAVLIVGVDERTRRLIIPEGPRSPMCTTILGLPPGEAALDFEATILDHMDLPEDRKNIFRDTLKSSIGLDELSWSINSVQLVPTMYFGSGAQSCHVSVTFAPIYNKAGEIQSLLLTVLDDTAQIAAAAREKEREEKLEVMLELVGIGRTKAAQAVQVVTDLSLTAASTFYAARNLLDFTILAQTAKDVFIPLHTAKGNARTFGLSRFSALLHEVEQIVTPLRTPLEHPPSDVYAATENAREAFGRLETFARRYESLMTELGWLQVGEVTIPQAAYFKARSLPDWAAMKSAIDDGKDAAGELESFLAPGFRRLASLRPAAEESLRRVARLMQKPVPDLDCDFAGLWVYAECFEQLTALMPHLCANALDHGIEAPTARQAQGKTSKGRIRLTACLQGEQLFLRFADDGQGLCPDHIATIALEKGVRNKEELASLSDEEKALLIFENGISSKAVATEVSGRGVGMAAIRQDMQQLGGRVSLELAPGKSHEKRAFAIVLVIPSHLVWHTERDEGRPRLVS